ncbi:phenazine biosynthesis protein phzE [Actinacidiphila yanglinensis]|uniref:anthranilate synthase n=1 Tax=Actinacidiphila yanglinensis TaxID=310779 RepID=A0A1H5TI91_9ACTN|nr:anthranilate synthase family protein [Actinacidiphila yanglinensis]SEF61821.1 phenazine biosynthesis protein phzE [Actinacidiphila yanglinensis]
MPLTPPSGPAPLTAARLVERLLAPGCPAFALLHRRTPGRPQDVVEVLLGPVEHVDTLAGIPLPSGTPDAPVTDALALVPYRQIRERGFDVYDDGTPLAVLRPQEAYELPLDEVLPVLEALPGARDVRVENGAFDVDDDAYAGIVRRVIDDEIGRGEGANFVIRRTFHGFVPDFGPAAALTLFARLLRGERGAYWTYTVHTPERTLVGASPEVHVRMAGGTVVMNPISGTYRYPAQGPSAEGLLEFLHDPKEVEELTMVVDEELKMMCTVGDLGGVVIGPRLKEMAHLAHTEYELRGRSTKDVRDVLRETMFAATVTGSPVQNACRVIERYEPRGRDGAGRGYYAGALALIGRDTGGAQTLDSPILIRTADISPGGTLKVPVGATLVRHSDPAAEVAETHAKAAGVLTALGVLAPSAPARPTGEPAPRPRLAEDIRVRAALDARRARLAPFWLRMRTASDPAPATTDAAPVLVVDAEDTFTAMLAHVLRSGGRGVAVRRYDEPGLREAALAHPGPVVLGPGPGDPSDTADAKMRFLRGLTAELVRDHAHGLLGVCLGHELIAAELGVDLVRKERPAQGAQEVIDYFGTRTTVGFYNTFTARCDADAAEELAMHGVELSRDLATGDLHALRGPGFAGIQFHPESVLSLTGAALLSDLLTHLSPTLFRP